MIVVLQVVLIAVILGMVVYGVFEGEGAGGTRRAPVRSGRRCARYPDDYGATITVTSPLPALTASVTPEAKDAEARRDPRAIFLTALIGGHDLHLCNLFHPRDCTSPDISRFKIRMRLSRKSCCTWRVKPSGWYADLLYYHHLASGMAAHAGVARLMCVMGRDGVFEKLLRLRSSEMAYASDEHHHGRRRSRCWRLILFW